jgi:hypothetical protein
MSLKERIRLVIMNNCTVSVDMEHVSPNDLIELADLAQARKVPITFRNALKNDPKTLTELTARGQAGGIAFEF